MPDHCDHDGPCPDDHGRQRHPGQVCQSGALPAGIVLPAPPITGLIVGSQAEVPALVTTVAPTAAAGSGCGPPALTELSIWRI